VSWFKEHFGYEPERKPILRIDEGQEVIVTLLNDEPRRVKSKRGMMLLIDVKVNDEEYTLNMSHVSLARQLAMIARERGTLKDVKVKIANLGRTGRTYDYSVEVISE